LGWGQSSAGRGLTETETEHEDVGGLSEQESEWIGYPLMATETLGLEPSLQFLDWDAR